MPIGCHKIRLRRGGERRLHAESLIDLLECIGWHGIPRLPFLVLHSWPFWMVHSFKIQTNKPYNSRAKKPLKRMSLTRLPEKTVKQETNEKDPYPRRFWWYRDLGIKLFRDNLSTSPGPESGNLELIPIVTMELSLLLLRNLLSSCSKIRWDDWADKPFLGCWKGLLTKYKKASSSQSAHLI